MRILILLTSIIFSFSQTAFPCSFSTDPIPFCQTTGGSLTLVASGKIIKKVEKGYLIELNSVYKGSEERCEIKVFLRENWSCTGTPVVYKLDYMGEPGDIILFTAFKIESPETSWQEAGQYYTAYSSIAGYDPFTAPLKLSGNKFKGFFAKGQNNVRSDQVFEELRNCGAEGINLEERVLCGALPLKLFPNPASSTVFLDQNSESYEEILIYDLKGNLVEKYSGYDPANGLNISSLSAGIYFVQAKSDSFVFRQKLLVN